MQKEEGDGDEKERTIREGEAMKTMDVDGNHEPT